MRVIQRWRTGEDLSFRAVQVCILLHSLPCYTSTLVFTAASLSDSSGPMEEAVTPEDEVMSRDVEESFTSGEEEAPYIWSENTPYTWRGRNCCCI